jgi:hypothetical protein
VQVKSRLDAKISVPFRAEADRSAAQYIGTVKLREPCKYDETR